MSARDAGPVEAFAFPTELSAHAVAPSERPRLHGYDVQGDLARHYGFGEVVLTALTGEAPPRAIGRAFEAALTFALPAPPSEAPGHASILARLCGASDAAVVSVGAIAAAERAGWVVREHAGWLAWLDAQVAEGGAERAHDPPRDAADTARDAAAAPAHDPGRAASPDPARDATPPAAFASDADREAVARLIDAAGLARAPWPAGFSPTLDAAVLAVLHRCGLRTAPALTSALTLAALPTAAAEAFAVRPASFRDYPMDLPRFEYAGESDEPEESA